MSCMVQWLRSPRWLRAAALALTAIGVAACSGDLSRFNDNPFESKSSPEATGSIQQAQAAPVGHVESRPLPPQNPQLASSQNATSAPAVISGTAGAGKTMGSPARSSTSPDATGAVTASKPAPAGRWTWQGGTAIMVAQGETVDSIARRHGVPRSAIIQANNIAAPGILYPGQHLVIPRYILSTRATVPKTAQAASAAGNPGVHVVAVGETLSKISRLYGKPVSEIAKANNIQITATLNVGDRLIIPGMRTSAVRPQSAPVVADAKPAAFAQEPEPTASASVFAPVGETQGTKDSAKAAEATGALPKFRWPATGRVIAGFGPTSNGQQNDGINIAVPENTPVKAAEDGVVAYAGNELKGYGNLVLVRHSNGYVTAYAHAKELLVKRGDQVKRGQVIARSGQSGNVNAPQLHFEIRKGASPVDPTKFLSGA